jgi:hypothetical protein
MESVFAANSLPEYASVPIPSHAALSSVDITVSIPNTVDTQIKDIFEKNKVDDLNRFIAKRAVLNKFTAFLMYGSYIFQSTGIFVTTVATGYKFPELTWVGIGLNMMSTLMIVFEKINVSISTRILKDIQSIKDGTYVDEGVAMDDTKKDDSKKST